MGHLANDWVAGTIWIIAPAIATSLGLGPTEVGLILAINGVGAGLCYIPAGMIADRSKRPGLLMLMTFWWVAIGYFLATLVPGFWPITLLLALGVMGDAFWHPVATGVLVKEMPERRAQALGIHAVGGSIGAEVLGPLSAGFLLGFFDWQTTMQILIIPALVMGVFFIPMSLRISRESTTVVQTINFKVLINHWAQKTGLGLMLVLIFYNMTLMAILSMMPLFLQIDHGLTAFHSGLIFAGFLVIGSFLQPGLGRYTDTRGRRQVVLLFLFLAATFALFAGLSQGLYWALLGLFPALVMLTAIRPVLLAIAVEYSSQSASTTLGIVFTVLDGVGMVGALFAGLIGEINLAYAFMMAAVFATLAGLIFLQLPDTKSVSEAVSSGAI